MNAVKDRKPNVGQLVRQDNLHGHVPVGTAGRVVDETLTGEGRIVLMVLWNGQKEPTAASVEEVTFLGYMP